MSLDPDSFGGRTRGRVRLSPRHPFLGEPGEAGVQNGSDDGANDRGWRYSQASRKLPDASGCGGAGPDHDGVPRAGTLLKRNLYACVPALRRPGHAVDAVAWIATNPAHSRACRRPTKKTRTVVDRRIKAGLPALSSDKGQPFIRAY